MPLSRATCSIADKMQREKIVLRARENYKLSNWWVACAAEPEHMHTLKCGRMGSSAGATYIENCRYVNG